jgi:formiminotetrahydrofolate cyclodeaminase
VTSAPASPPEALGRFQDRFGLATLIEALSSAAENPASGSAASAAAAFAAALVAKVAHGAGDEGAAAQAELLAARLTGLAAEDADAYAAAVTALAQPRDSESHDFLLGTTLRRAADVPLQIAESAADVASLAASLADSAPPDQHADAVGAALLAEGATRAAAHLVEINLAARPGDERHRRARGSVQSAAASVSKLAAGTARA